MDGPTIAAATEAALRGGVRVRDAFTAVEAISNAGGRAVVMTYWNPVLHRGVDAFARDLASAGGLGMITPDLIPDEADEWIRGIRGARPGPDLPGGAVVDAGAAGRRPCGVARIRLRGVDDGRDRCARRGVERRARAGRAGSRRSRTSRSASDWGCGPANRPHEIGAYADGVIVGFGVGVGARGRHPRRAGLDRGTR